MFPWKLCYLKGLELLMWSQQAHFQCSFSHSSITWTNMFGHQMCLDICNPHCKHNISCKVVFHTLFIDIFAVFVLCVLCSAMCCLVCVMFCYVSQLNKCHCLLCHGLLCHGFALPALDIATHYFLLIVIVYFSQL